MFTHVTIKYAYAYSMFILNTNIYADTCNIYTIIHIYTQYSYKYNAFRNVITGQYVFKYIYRPATFTYKAPILKCNAFMHQTRIGLGSLSLRTGLTKNSRSLDVYKHRQGIYYNTCSKE